MGDQGHKTERLRGFAIGEDGKTVSIYLNAPAEGVPDVMITMPTENVEDFWNHLGDLVETIRAANGGKVEPKPPQMAVSWKVGGNTMAPGMTALMFDADLPSQRIILMPDLAALQMADSIEQKVFDGLSVVDQRSMLKEVEKARGGKPRLIIPRGRN